MADLNPFPPEALAANRAGQLTEAQRQELGADHVASRRSGWQAGLGLCAFGGLLLFGAVSGRIDSGRVGAGLMGAVVLAGGLALMLARGRTRSTKASGEAAAGQLGVEAVAGDIRKVEHNRDLGNELVGAPSSRAENRYYWTIEVAGRRFDVNKAMFDAAPREGSVVAYALAGTDRLINLELVGPSQRMAGFVDRAAERGVHTGYDPASVGGTLAGPGPAPAPAADAPVLDGAALAAAVAGRWANPSLHLWFEFHPDGTLGGPEGTSRWWVAGPGRIGMQEGGEMPVSVTGDRLFLQTPAGPTLELHRA